MVDRKIPIRRCVGCGQGKAKKELVRIVRTAEGDILLDSTGRKAGRGAYVCQNTACLAAAQKKKALERAFSCAVPIQIYVSLAQQLSEGGQSGG